VKILFFVSLLSITLLGSAQKLVPTGTMVTLTLNKDVFAPAVKVGEAADFVVLQDVTVKGKVVIPAKAKVRAAVVDVNKGGPHQGDSRVKVQIYDVMAMDGSTVGLDDCYILVTGDGGHKQHGALILKGIGKNCLTK
jgi:hypothetical protein